MKNAKNIHSVSYLLSSILSFIVFNINLEANGFKVFAKNMKKHENKKKEKKLDYT